MAEDAPYLEGCVCPFIIWREQGACSGCSCPLCCCFVLFIRCSAILWPSTVTLVCAEAVGIAICESNLQIAFIISSCVSAATAAALFVLSACPSRSDRLSLVYVCWLLCSMFSLAQMCDSAMLVRTGRPGPLRKCSIARASISAHRTAASSLLLPILPCASPLPLPSSSWPLSFVSSWPQT